MHEPHLIHGKAIRDNRGVVSFVNDFNFSDVKRMYAVQNKNKGMVRAWHGHKKEAKYVICISGSAMVAAVAINDNEPTTTDQVYTFVLTSDTPEIVYIPSGYANGFKSLTRDAKLIFFSTTALDDSKNDDYRYAPRTWDIWGEVEDEMMVT